MTDAAHFIRSVLDLAPAVAAFDCDGTLWDADSGERFFYWEIEEELVPVEVARWALPRYRDYQQGKVGEVEMCGEMVTLHEGLAVADLERGAQRFYRQFVARHVFPEMRELVQELARRGCEIWAVSSTNQWVVEAGAADFGIPAERALAAAVRCSGGRATGELLRVPSGVGKAAALSAALRRPLDAAFGNSIHDAAMLAMARHPFVVNPNPDLLALARDRGWPVYQPEAAAALPHPSAES